jgi:bifunctional non-homologous end joining protein LigD
MQRFPDGITKEGFFQKNAGDYFPDWISTIPIKKQEDGTVKYVIINNKATLVYLANQGIITPHPWLSKTDKLDYPDKMIFDLDPAGTATFKDVQWAATALKTLLNKLGLPTFVMTTGSRGAHVIIPLKRTQTFDTVRTFALDCARIIAQQYPEKATVDMNKTKRDNKIFIDWLRNGFGATGVAPYAVRAKEKAPVATPLSWNEFLHIASSQEYNITTIFQLLHKHKDPWATMKKKAVSLTKARKKLDTLLATIKKI